MPESAVTIYTLGHSNHSIERFLDLASANGIDVLIDTRTSPYSRFSPQFNLRELGDAAGSQGIAYLFLGAELGGRPEGDEYYDLDGYVRYDRVAATPAFVAGLARILDRARSGAHAALLCGEEDPAGCHRRLLVGRALELQGASIVHIRADGRLQPESELAREETGSGSGQLAMFDDVERPWRSALPVRRAARG